MKLELRTFPPGDQQFKGEVERAGAQRGVVADEKEGIDPAELVGLMRSHYPNVSVHTASELGSLATTRVVWYVFRDSRVRPDDWRRERLYEALARARTVISDSRRAIRRGRTTTSDPGNSWSRDQRD